MQHNSLLGNDFLQTDGFLDDNFGGAPSDSLLHGIGALNDTSSSSSLDNAFLQTDRFLDDVLGSVPSNSLLCAIGALNDMSSSSSAVEEDKLESPFSSLSLSPSSSPSSSSSLSPSLSPSSSSSLSPSSSPSSSSSSSSSFRVLRQDLKSLNLTSSFSLPSAQIQLNKLCQKETYVEGRKGFLVVAGVPVICGFSTRGQAVQYTKKFKKQLGGRYTYNSVKDSVGCQTLLIFDKERPYDFSEVNRIKVKKGLTILGYSLNDNNIIIPDKLLKKVRRTVRELRSASSISQSSSSFFSTGVDAVVPNSSISNISFSARRNTVNADDSVDAVIPNSTAGSSKRKRPVSTRENNPDASSTSQNSSSFFVDADAVASSSSTSFGNTQSNKKARRQ